VAGVPCHAAFQLSEAGTSGPRRPGREASRRDSVLQWFWQHKGAVSTSSRQQPPTLSHSLADSPAVLLAWNAQLFDESLTTTSSSPRHPLHGLPAPRAHRSATTTEDTPSVDSQLGPTGPIGHRGNRRRLRSIPPLSPAATTPAITSWTRTAGVPANYSAHPNPDQLAARNPAFLRQPFASPSHKEN